MRDSSPSCFYFFGTAAFKENEPPGKQLIGFLNSYQAQKLARITSDDFIIVSGWSSYITSREDFLGEYIHISKAVNAKFNIRDTLSLKPEKYRVEDESDYLKLLEIDYPEWILSFEYEKSGKVSVMRLDTTDSYTRFKEQYAAKERLFYSWLSLQYPADSATNLGKKPKLLMERLREYRNRNNK